MKASPQFFCYAPRPKHVELDGLNARVYETLRDARGIFKAGMTGKTIWLQVAHDCPPGATPSVSDVRLALRELRRLGIAEQDAANVELWRLKK